MGELKGSQLEDDASKRESLVKFLEKVAVGKLVRQYTNPDELKAQVLHALQHAFNFRPQEGWVRGRNMRRLKDLEQINELQKQLRQLEAENAQLKQQQHDPAELFAQGMDQFRHEFELVQSEVPRPVDKLTVFGTWDDLFVVLFQDGLPIVYTQECDKKIVDYLKRRIQEMCPEAGEWVVRADVGQLGSTYPLFKNGIRVQLQGLSLISITRGKLKSGTSQRRESSGWHSWPDNNGLIDRGGLLSKRLLQHSSRVQLRARRGGNPGIRGSIGNVIL